MARVLSRAPRSITVRLVLAAVVWMASALVVTGLVLTGLFREHAARAFDSGLRAHMLELLALSAVDGGGRVVLGRHPVDPQFNQPLSGWYWQMDFGGGRIETSRSLWDSRLAVPPVSDEVALSLPGPRHRGLRVVARRFTLPGADTPFVIAMAGPAEDIERAVRRFAGILAGALLVLGLGLTVAVVGQVHFGLTPLRRLRVTLAAVRRGEAARLDGPFPAELEPLARELNALLDHDAAVVARARTQAGNLAHALKTPLAVIANDAASAGGAAGERLRRQVTALEDTVARHLKRARVAAAKDVLGVRTAVAPAADALGRVLCKVHGGRSVGPALDVPAPVGPALDVLAPVEPALDVPAPVEPALDIPAPVELTLDIPADVVFAGEREDLDEMLGNLMDNAVTWAAHRVAVAGRADGGRLVLTVDDDGPGIPEGRRAEALGRGRRLDEATPGSGLGLAIVCEVAEAYGGTVTLGTAPAGGLRAELVLPAADHTGRCRQ